MKSKKIILPLMLLGITGIIGYNYVSKSNTNETTIQISNFPTTYSPQKIADVGTSAAMTKLVLQILESKFDTAILLTSGRL